MYCVINKKRGVFGLNKYEIWAFYTRTFRLSALSQKLRRPRRLHFHINSFGINCVLTVFFEQTSELKESKRKRRDLMY